jgi:iron complex transport system substrate-binding protein
MYSALRFIFIMIIAASLDAKSVADMDGKRVTLPDQTDRVFGSSPPMSYLIYALNPDKMIGLNFKARNANNRADKAFLKPEFLALPVIGSFHGGGQSINLETLMAYKPQLVLLWQDDMLLKTVRKEIEKTTVPSFMIPFRKIGDMPRAFRLAGNAIGEPERGEMLADYSEKIIDEVRSAAAAVKPARYYYAEGIDGLSTECDQSFHVEAFNFAGGSNVHKCRQSGLLGLEKISFETLLAYDPDVIIVQNSSVYFDLANDPLWQKLRAVKNGRIHRIPADPFNWVDRPPSFMRVIGIQWLATLFHPESYKADLNRRTQEFYELFLDVKITDEQIKNLLGADL